MSQPPDEGLQGVGCPPDCGSSRGPPQPGHPAVGSVTPVFPSRGLPSPPNDLMSPQMCGYLANMYLEGELGAQLCRGGACPKRPSGRTPSSHCRRLREPQPAEVEGQ